MLSGIDTNKTNENSQGSHVNQKNNVLGTTFAGIIERNDIDNNTLYVKGLKDNDINYDSITISVGELKDGYPDNPNSFPPNIVS